MEIRRAALADIPGVCACCVAAFKDYIPLIGQTPGPMLEDYCQARKEHFLFVAAQGASVLSCALSSLIIPSEIQNHNEISLILFHFSKSEYIKLIKSLILFIHNLFSVQKITARLQKVWLLA